MKLVVSLVPGALTDPILSGACGIEGAELDVRQAKMVDGNSRQMLDLAFDVAEMSLATFTKARAEGAPLIGLPVFTGRRFLEPGMGARPEAGIEHPAQLAGKRVGVPQFWMTSSVWHRAVLSNVYGVPENTIEWITVQPERFDLPFTPGVKVTHRPGEKLDELLRRGEIDAVMFPRPVEEHFDAALARRPFPYVVAAQRAFHSKTGIFPIMHFVVMKEALHRDRPGLARRVIDAFQRAKDTILAKPAAIPARDLPFHGADFGYARGVLGDDPWPYGIAANAPALQWFLARAHEQGLTRRRLAPEALFVESE